jgi:hypothetical protein
MIVACTALAFSLGGVGYAASLPHNSVGRAQLRNNAVDSTKVANHSLHLVDFAGGEIPAPMTGDLPSGVTLRGSFFFGHTDLNPHYPGPVAGSLDFGGFRLSAAPAAHVIDTADAPTAACPGSAAAPEAAPGAFCLYVSDRQGASGISILAAADETFANGIDRTFANATDTPRSTSGNVSRVGAHVFVNSDATLNLVSVRGTWAVTAP